MNKVLYTCLLIFVVCNIKVHAASPLPQFKRVSVLPPDSVAFVANDKDDWELVQSYIVKTGVLVTVELLLQRNNDEHVQWEAPLMIGRLAKEYLPVVRKDFMIVQPNRTWKLVIAENGKCFLQLINGSKPRKRNATVITIQVRYSN